MTRKFVCDECDTYTYQMAYGIGQAPACRTCGTPMHLDMKQPERVEEPPAIETLGPYWSSARQGKFEELMRDAFTNEAGLAGYAEV